MAIESTSLLTTRPAHADSNRLLLKTILQTVLEHCGEPPSDQLMDDLGRSLVIQFSVDGKRFQSRNLPSMDTEHVGQQKPRDSLIDRALQEAIGVGSAPPHATTDRASTPDICHRRAEGEGFDEAGKCPPKDDGIDVENENTRKKNEDNLDVEGNEPAPKVQDSRREDADDAALLVAGALLELSSCTEGAKEGYNTSSNGSTDAFGLSTKSRRRMTMSELSDTTSETQNPTSLGKRKIVKKNMTDFELDVAEPRTEDEEEDELPERETSVLPRPINKKRYRLIADIMDQTKARGDELKSKKPRRRIK